jgi:hypothetical protein
LEQANKAIAAAAVKCECPGKHVLVPFVTPGAGFVCDLCRDRVGRGAPMAGCRICDFDACNACVDAHSPQLREGLRRAEEAAAEAVAAQRAADKNPFSKANYVPSGAGDRLAALERANAALTQQLAQKDEQLAEQAAQLAEKDERIAALDVAAAPPTAAATPPAAPSVQFMTAEQAQQAAAARRAAVLAGKLMKWAAFLSHSKRAGDRTPALVRKLKRILGVRGHEVFFDEDNLVDITLQALKDAIAESAVFLVFADEVTFDSEWCRAEMAFAAELGVPILTIIDMDRYPKEVFGEEGEPWRSTLAEHGVEGKSIIDMWWPKLGADVWKASVNHCFGMGSKQVIWYNAARHEDALEKIEEFIYKFLVGGVLAGPAVALVAALEAVAAAARGCEGGEQRRANLERLEVLWAAQSAARQALTEATTAVHEEKAKRETIAAAALSPQPARDETPTQRGGSVEGWTCVACTFEHHALEEQAFLQCAVCAAPRDMPPAHGAAQQQEGGGGAGERGGAAGGAAWMAAWQAADVALAPLRLSRAGMAEGGDAASAADALLERATRAVPFGVFGEFGGSYAGCVAVTKFGAHIRCSAEPSGYAHAATAPSASSFDVRLKIGAKVRYLYLGLAAPGKDLDDEDRGGEDIYDDKDVWLYDVEDGDLYSACRNQGKAEALRPGAVLRLVYDAGAATLRFLRDERLLGQLEGVVPNPKIVVSMGKAESGVEFVYGSDAEDNAERPLRGSDDDYDY